jgi:hypothetical protein
MDEGKCISKSADMGKVSRITNIFNKFIPGLLLQLTLQTFAGFGVLH